VIIAVFQISIAVVDRDTIEFSGVQLAYADDGDDDDDDDGNDDRDREVDVNSTQGKITKRTMLKKVPVALPPSTSRDSDNHKRYNGPHNILNILFNST
jgi:hypothetical protein